MSDRLVEVVLVMAGGSGDRFWPLSRGTRPKQLLRLLRPDQTLLEAAVERATWLAPPERVWIATSEELRAAVRAAAPALPPDNILAEPAKRSTLGCLIYATACLLHRWEGDGSNLLLAVLSADHAMDPPAAAQATLRLALDTARDRDALVLIGVPATHPHPGYGYIETAAAADTPVAVVERFYEKPSVDQAAALLARGRCAWNSGMFFWRVSVFLQQLRAVDSALEQTVHDLAAALAAGDDARARTIFAALPDLPIDKALIERARQTIMVRAACAWDDLGAWDALERHRPRDHQGNVVIGDALLVDARGCIVYNETAGATVAALGVEDLVIVVVDDAVLVLPKARAQEARRIAEAWRQRRGAGGAS